MYKPKNTALLHEEGTHIIVCCNPDCPWGEEIKDYDNVDEMGEAGWRFDTSAHPLTWGNLNAYCPKCAKEIKDGT